MPVQNRLIFDHVVFFSKPLPSENHNLLTVTGGPRVFAAIASVPQLDVTSHEPCTFCQNLTFDGLLRFVPFH